jgi:deazaflavin-dependent oxidoreductase (nitroreductase family)
MTDMADFNAGIIKEFRANKGKLGGAFEGAPVLLLHTTGAKSGQERINPLVYLPHEGRKFIFASKGGFPSHPDWYRNLVANPDVTVEIGEEVLTARASTVSEPERSEIYVIQEGKMPGFAEYREKAGRTIPVVELVGI